MEASYEEIARSIQISGSFAGGRRHPTERESIDGGKSERSTRSRTWRLRGKQHVFLVPDLNARVAKSKSVSMTIAQLCSHFEQSELCLTNTWRSYSTKNIYKVYLKRWITPRWSEQLLSDIRTIEVESWLRSLPIARSTCAKIRNVMSVLFNHACRYEFFDGNPIRLVRQSAKRRSPPVVLTAGEIRILLEGLKIRERTLVFIAASTGIRQSELFALKWGDINFLQEQ